MTKPSKSTIQQLCTVEISFYDDEEIDAEAFMDQLGEWLYTACPGFSGLLSLKLEPAHEERQACTAFIRTSADKFCSCGLAERIADAIEKGEHVA